ncbi:MAG: hypothetical protein PHN51_01390 [Candidatus Nanopelagicales bacterium]|nr:hypothetical protein [Candidatus Nanopelagicales bacterium]
MRAISFVTKLTSILISFALSFVSISEVNAATPSYLFTVQSVSGSTSVLPAGPGVDERFTLSLRGVDPVTKFADRPFRSASVMSPSALVSNWNSWFASSAPNAVLTYSRGAGIAPSSIVVTLSHPRYSASGRSLSFTATRTYRAVDPLQKGSNWVRPVTPRTFVSASLFIDDAGSGSTDALVASLQQSLQQYVFAPNNATTWAAATSSLSAIMNQAWMNGTGNLMGATASQAYTVSCMTPFNAQMVLNGYMTCTVTMQLMSGGQYVANLKQQMAVSG